MESHSYDRCKWHQSRAGRLFLAVVACGILIFALSGAAVFKYNIVIEDEDVQTIVYTSEDDPAEILKTEGIILGAHDKFLMEDEGGNQKNIVVKRAAQIDVTADGQKHTVYQIDGTVRDALDTLGIPLNDADFINVALTEPVNGDMDVVVNRVTTKTIERVSEIPFTVTKVPTQTLKKGSTRTLIKGVNGKQTVTIEQTLMDGKVVSEETVSTKITQHPVASKVLIGDPSAPVSELTPASNLQLDKNGNPISYKQKLVGKATAYSALGKPTRLVPGCVAMDTSKFPKGTRLYIKTPDGSFTYGYSEVKDTGPAVRNGHCLVDLFFASYRESCLFGAKTVEVYVL